jgi:hypothetical protein
MAVWRRLALLALVFWVPWLYLATAPVPVASENIAAPTAETVPIEVRNGAAKFDLPVRSHRDQFLIVVSSLSRDAGPYQVEVETEPTSKPRAIQTTNLSPDRAWKRRIDGYRQSLNAARQVVETAEAQTNSAQPPVERTFWIMVRGNDFALAKNYQAVQSRLWAKGQHCAIYVDQDCVHSDRLENLVQDTKKTFDDAVCPAATRLLGRHRDVDGDGRFTILLTPWLSRLSDGTVSLGGFVRGSDFYWEVEPPLGNRCDMMYLNAELNAGPHVRTLIAHEYTHAITLCEHVFNRYLPDRLGQEEESWLDESIAHLAENLHNYSWSNLDHRISAFLSDPERYRLVVDDYYAAGIWRGHGNRGSTYLFLRWCVDHYGPEILRDLVQTNLVGVENIEVAVGRPFDELYRDWSVAIYLSHSGLDKQPLEALRFLHLRGELNGRLLAGPRHESIRLDGDSRRFELVGTSTKYLIAHSSAGPAARLRIQSLPESQLQVSIRPLPQNLARLELAATPADSSSANGLGVIRIHIKECNGVAVNLQQMAWERSTRGTNRDADRGYCSPVLGAAEIERLFGTTVVPPSGSLNAQQVDIRTTSRGEAPLLLKITGRDASGHVLSAWHPLQLDWTNLERTASNAETVNR